MRGMKNSLTRLMDKLLAHKQAIVESIIDRFKNTFQVEHSRHRCLASFLVNLAYNLMAYCDENKKPLLKLKFALTQLT